MKLEKVTEENWREVINLEVKASQHSFIESNAQSLLEAAYDTSLRWYPFAVIHEKKIIGFTMIGNYNPEEKWIWLDRIMLGKEAQGKGLGTDLLNEIVTTITENWDVHEIVLSVTPDNDSAIGFYEKFGFEWLDKTDPENGEKLMRLRMDTI